MKFRPQKLKPQRFLVAIFLGFCCFSNLVQAQSAPEPQPLTQPPAPSNVAQQDYDAYKSTKYASPKWNVLVQEGIEAFHNEQYDVSQNNLFKAFNLGCQSPIVLFQLALINEYQKAYYSAVEFYKMAKESFGSANQNHRYNQTFYENYGRALYYSGKIDEALPMLQKASKNTNSFWLLKLLGMISFEQGDTLNATAYFERAVRQPSSEITKEELVYIYTLLARMYLQKGEQDGAMRYYYQVTQVDPNNAEAKRFTKGIQQNVYDKSMKTTMDKMINE